MLVSSFVKTLAGETINFACGVADTNDRDLRSDVIVFCFGDQDDFQLTSVVVSPPGSYFGCFNLCIAHDNVSSWCGNMPHESFSELVSADP
ncbi:hypothetical protein CYJ10_17070 [Cupriavidus pauculus]|uniref:Uncharacterized protein n=1 Tax=Cupriavidus pauculus TaxID=82633 RepID=A0A2N5CBH3_9BURK|nr:hypothetical protein CYJ10_17070 [Cupriavidus pauculus]